MNLLCILFDTGCFWGVERHCWSISGVFSIQVGYSGGFTPNSTYHEVCSDYSFVDKFKLCLKLFLNWFTKAF
uniref:peptide-methionine (S)-S-oxide reductase n=2 Tax=Cyprinus carpio TaxID=7962 RepID=A0A8C2HZC1_CYPCA